MQLLARAAQGSLRDALSILDQAISFGGGTIEEAGVRDMLGAIDQSYLYELLDALAHKDGARMLAIADAMESRSVSFDAALQDLASLLHRIALAQIVPSAIAEDTPEREHLLALAKTFVAEDIQLFYQIAIHGRGDLGRAPDEYAGFTMTLMRMLAFMPEDISANPAPIHSHARPQRSTRAVALPIGSRGADAQVKPASPSATRPGTATSAAAATAVEMPATEKTDAKTRR